MAFRPDGGVLAVHLFGGELRIFDLESGDLLATREAGHEFYPGFSPDGRFLVTSHADDGLQLFDARSFERLRAIPAPLGLLSAAFRADSALLAFSTAGGGVGVVDVERGELLRVLDGHEGRRCVDVRFLPDGRLVSVGWDNVARVWEPESGRQLDALQGHADHVDGLAVSDCGRFLATSSADHTGRVWSLASAPPYVALEIPGTTGRTTETGAVHFSPDGSRVAASVVAGGVWSLPGLALEDGRGDTYRESPDGRLRSQRVDGTLVVEERDGGRVLARIEADARNHHAEWHPREPRLAYSLEGAVHVWTEGEGSRVVPGFHGRGGLVYDLVWHPDGRRLVLAWNVEVIEVDAESGAILRRDDSPTRSPRAVALSADGARLAVASDRGTVVVRDHGTLELHLVLEGHTQRVWAIAWHPDGSRIATGSQDGTVKIWETRGGRLLLTLPLGEDVAAVAFGPGGRRLGAVDRTGRLHLWTTLPRGPAEVR